MENNSMRAPKEDDSDSYSDYSEVEVEVEEEEALSLCDLPLEGEKEDYYQQYPPISQTSSEGFEFFSTENTPSMLSTEDIIFCGKILPYRSSAQEDGTANNNHHHRRHHRKSESLNDLQRSHSSSKDGGSSKYMRNSRSLDYKKLHRDSSFRKSSSSTTDGKCFGNCDLSSFGRIPVSPTQTTTTKPKWRLLMFGVMKTPREMELKDIRNRQSRLIPSSFFTVSTVNKREEQKGSWKLLRALSCKSQVDTVITASLSCV